MDYTNEEYRKKIIEFTDYWDIPRISKLKLKEYTGVNNHTTFCYWLEVKTNMLGEIRGVPADKFMIFKRRDPKQRPKPKYHYSDSEYTWKKSLSKKRKIAFEKVRDRILNVIKYSQKGDFNNIDEIELHNFLKWKVAYLYSNENLFPAFEKELLIYAAKKLGKKYNKNAKVSEIQTFIMQNKPSKQTIYEFSNEIWKDYNKNKSKDIPNDDPSLEVIEGNKKLIKEHLKKERSSKFRNYYRKLYKDVLNCPACKFNFQKNYNVINGNSYLEMHHIIPLAFVNEPTKISKEDVTLLCPNCHRAVHKIMNAEKKKKILLNDFIKNYLK